MSFLPRFDTINFYSNGKIGSHGFEDVFESFFCVYPIVAHQLQLTYSFDFYYLFILQDQEIKAEDPDLGLFGEIQFHLNGSERHQFIIDPITGVISTRKFPPPTLDHEKIGNYSFYVVAVDERGTGCF